MKKIIITTLIIGIMLPNITFSYSVSRARSYSVPVRAYSAPIRSYSVPVRSYSAPKIYSVPKTYSVPTKNYVENVSVNTTKNTIPKVIPDTITKSVSSVNRTNYFNPFSSNFFLWYFIFFNNNKSLNINQNATTTKN